MVGLKPVEQVSFISETVWIRYLKPGDGLPTGFDVGTLLPIDFYIVFNMWTMLKVMIKNKHQWQEKTHNYNKLYRFSQQELLNVLQEAGWVQEPCGQSAFDKILMWSMYIFYPLCINEKYTINSRLGDIQTVFTNSSTPHYIL